jgi:hypothetical protein
VEKISSGSTFFFKRVFPLFWFGFLAFVVVTGLVSGAVREQLPFILVPSGMAVFGFLLMKKLVWDLADEVYDGGDFLLVRNRGEEERIALSNIMNVSASSFVNPPRIALRLVRPGKFGNEVSFSPRAPLFRFNPLSKNAVAENLIVRVDRARAKRSA